jgi:hypothetical protein
MGIESVGEGGERHGVPGELSTREAHGLVRSGKGRCRSHLCQRGEASHWFARQDSAAHLEERGRRRAERIWRQVTHAVAKGGARSEV